MSAPVIWILFPGTIAVISFIFRRFQRVINTVTFLTALMLGILASLMRIGETIDIGYLPFLPTIIIQDTFFVLGRSFVLDQDSQITLVLIYLSAAFWFGGALITPPTDTFLPIGLGLVALFTAAFSVEPFLYAAPIILIATLISVLILVPPGSQPNQGVYRFITFQTLGMPFILIAGWFLSGIETEITDQILLLRVTALLGLGFAFYMAIFPFHNWVPILAEKLHPYTVAFVIYFFPQAGSLLVLSFLSRYSWFSVAPDVFAAIRVLGGLMVFFGGFWAAFQNHLGRMMGFAALMEIGFTLLAIGALEPDLNPNNSFAAQEINFSAPLLGIYYAQFFPRLIGLAIWALALVVLTKHETNLDIRQIEGIGYRLPITAISIIIAIFSLAGLPLLAGFPIRIALWSTIVTKSLPIAVIVLTGIFGLFLAGFRSLSYLFRNSVGDWSLGENRVQTALLICGWVLLFLIGIFPNALISEITDIARIINTVAP